jgi:3-phenylpropionate/trans-cinnamate dioxygenase ferredoxin subunit
LLGSKELIEVQDHREYERSERRMAEEFVRVASSSEIPPDKMKIVQYKGQPVCLANVKGKYYAIRNACTHMGGPLAQGKLEDQIVECPWHGSRFDLMTGEVKRGPAQTPEQVYEVKTEGTSLLIRSK